MYLRECKLDEVHEELLPAHDNDELDGELVEAARNVALVAPEPGHSLAKGIAFLVTLSRVSEKFALQRNL